MTVGRAGPARSLVVGALVTLAAGAPARRAAAEGPARTIVDRTVVRFYSPEMGGTQRPRFIDERTLAFEARMEAVAEGLADGGYQERHIRAALERHVTEELLASLAHKLIEGSAPSKRPSVAQLANIRDDLAAAWVERHGGRERVDAAAAAEGLDATEVDAILSRQALAAWYLDRAVSPFLKPSEEQLHDVFRSSAHPYGGHPFEQVREALGRWFVIERMRVAESAFYQAMRSRVTIVVTR